MHARGWLPSTTVPTERERHGHVQSRAQRALWRLGAAARPAPRRGPVETREGVEHLGELVLGVLERHQVAHQVLQHLGLADARLEPRRAYIVPDAANQWLAW